MHMDSPNLEVKWTVDAVLLCTEDASKVLSHLWLPPSSLTSLLLCQQGPAKGFSLQGGTIRGVMGASEGGWSEVGQV